MEILSNFPRNVCQTRQNLNILKRRRGELRSSITQKTNPEKLKNLRGSDSGAMVQNFYFVMARLCLNGRPVFAPRTIHYEILGSSEILGV